MTWDKTSKDVWVVYNGGRLEYANAVNAINLKPELGNVFILDAREHVNHSLIIKINKRKFDLNQGIVVFFNNKFHYGFSAMHFLAKNNMQKNVIKTFLLCLCKNLILEKMVNTLIILYGIWPVQGRNVGAIADKTIVKDAIFKSVFNDSWNALPEVMKAHYKNTPYSTDVTKVRGTIHVFCKRPLIWFSFFINFFGLIPAKNKRDVSIDVSYVSEPNTCAFHLIRTFHFLGNKPYVFHSKMLKLKRNTIAEVMKLRFTWLCDYSWDGEKINLTHRGYALYVFSHFIPLPLTIFLGSGNATERPISNNEFEMEVTITHPWWGKIYGYNGRFKVLN